MRRIAALTLLVASLAVPDSAAYWEPSSAAVVRSFGCTAQRTSGDAVVSSDGVVRGFVRPVGGTCTAARPYYVERRNGVWSRSVAPFGGVVLSVADDGATTYLLYAALDGLRLATRTHGGTWGVPALLSNVRPRSGDVVAVGGKWWAVWSESLPDGRAALYQSRTMRTDRTKERITFAATVDDKPSLARLSDGYVALAWQRHDPATGDTDVYRGRSNGGTWEVARHTSNGTSTEPAVAAYGTKRLIAWTQSGRVAWSDDVRGAWQRRLVGAPGSAPRVAGSGPRTFVAWTTTAGNVALAERSGDVWTERGMTPGDAQGSALALTAYQGNATVLVAEPTRVVARVQARPSITAFRGLGAWIDLYDLSRPPAASVATMKANGVRTLYIETARYNSPSAIVSGNAAWLDAAKAAGLRVVAWYLPGYSEWFERDVAWTVAAARYRTARGNRYDAIGVDIEHQASSSSTAAFNRDAVEHLRRVRAALGPAYPIAAITIPPVVEQINPGGWGGFPWAGIGRYADVVMPMAYWSYRDCAATPRYCAYGYTAENIRLSARLTGLPVHDIGGVGNAVSAAEVRDFARAVEDSSAIGGSLYDYVTTSSSFWPYLRTLS